MNGMNFDAGTWWLIGLLLTALIGAVVYLIKRTLFSRVDDLTKEVKEVREGVVKKADYEKAQDRMMKDIEQIKKDYTPGASMTRIWARPEPTLRRSPRIISPRRTSSGSRPRRIGSWIEFWIF